MTSQKSNPTGGHDGQTHVSFSEKWDRNPSLAFDSTNDPNSSIQKWILERNGLTSLDDARKWLRSRQRVLDAGCGNGRVTALLASIAPHASVTGIDLVDLKGARQNTSALGNVRFENANLRNSLTSLGQFDLIYCQEVLHHTGDAAASFRNLVEILAPGGEIAIYVYRLKAPAREFMDDYVRERIAGLGYEAAMEVCRKITRLGQSLSAVAGDVEVEDIPELGIEAGRYTPQRLLYHFFLKCFWNPELSFEDNAVINYDWYHPQNCSRHTMAEVREWFDGAGLKVVWGFQDHYGITMRGIRA